MRVSRGRLGRVGAFAAGVALAIAIAPGLGQANAGDAPIGADPAGEPTAAASPGGARLGVRAQKAAAIFETYCAGCHQSGQLRALAPAGNLADIMDVEALALRPALVSRGLPDASKLYLVLLGRHAPLDVFQPDDGPSTGEVEAVRDWIDNLEPRAAGCPARPAYGQEHANRDMGRWLEQAGPEASADTRFVSLAHLYTGCASDHAIASAREAVRKILSSLSWSQTPARVETIGDAVALLALRLSDLGWTPALWDGLSWAEPEGGAFPVPETVRRATGAARPVVRGDWLAASAMRPPLYYELLGVPATLSETARLAGFDSRPEAKGRFARAGVKQSPVTRGPRLIEHHAGGSGASWLAHDFPASAPAEDVLALAASSGAAAPGVTGPAADAIRMTAALPNGLAAFALFDRDGRRIDRLPGTRGPDGVASMATEAGLGCLMCHAGGARAFKDDARAATGSGPAVADLVEADNARFNRALTQAGINPDRTEAGLEVVTALAKAYDEDAGLDRVAAEAGLAPEALARRLEAVTGDLAPAARRLLQGVSPRVEAERLLLALRVPAVNTPVAPIAEPVAARALDLLLASDRPVYAVGDIVTFTVQSSADCYLTLISVDTSQKATVLFPNDFEPDNLIAAGKPYRLPGDKAGYQLRSSAKGRETTVAICQTQAKIPPGVEIDYERQRFTILGNWRNFLNSAQAAEADQRASAIRGGRARGRAQPRPEARGAGEAELTARTAISYRVE